jgi:hypothetical protein
MAKRFLQLCHHGLAIGLDQRALPLADGQLIIPAAIVMVGNLAVINAKSAT